YENPLARRPARFGSAGSRSIAAPRGAGRGAGCGLSANRSHARVHRDGIGNAGATKSSGAGRSR
nr:hypothetical protein [Tanacetum cinerariifolium]